MPLPMQVSPCFALQSFLPLLQGAKLRGTCLSGFPIWKAYLENV